MVALDELRNYLDRYDTDLSNINLEYLKGLPFYCQWPNSESEEQSLSQIILPVIRTGDFCCFNHAIGLPQKNEKVFPLFDYEQMLYQRLEQYKHVWIKKATGLGVTEFMLRYMAWLCFNNTIAAGSQMCIVTGPRIELAITLIDRLKGLFQNRPIGTSIAC